MRVQARLIEQRKRDHLAPFRQGGVSAREITSWLECVRLVHSALPELSLTQIDLSCHFAGRRFSAPLFITGMTGGTEEAGQIKEFACLHPPKGVGKSVVVEQEDELRYRLGTKRWNKVLKKLRKLGHPV